MRHRYLVSLQLFIICSRPRHGGRDLRDAKSASGATPISVSATLLAGRCSQSRPVSTQQFSSFDLSCFYLGRLLVVRVRSSSGGSRESWTGESGRAYHTGSCVNELAYSVSDVQCDSELQLTA